MENVLLDCSATRAFAAVVVRRFVQMPVFVVLNILLSYPFLPGEATGAGWGAVALAAYVLSFLLIVVRLFVRDRLQDDGAAACRAANLGTCVASDVIRHLRRPFAPDAFALLDAATSSERGRFVLSQIGVSKEDVLQRCREHAGGIDVRVLLTQAKALLEHTRDRKIDGNTILFLFFQEGGPFREILNECDLGKEDLQQIVKWELFHQYERRTDPWYAPRALVRKFGAVGRSWTSGYTNQLDAFTDDLTEHVLLKSQRDVVIHRKEVDDAIHVLTRSDQHNVLVMGERGAGKRAFVENVAVKIRQAEVEHALRHTRVLVLHTAELLSGSEKPDAFLLSALKTARKSGRFILVIPDIVLFLRTQDGGASNVLQKFLQEKGIYIIGIADTRDYHMYVKTRPAMDALFEKMLLTDPPEEETMAVLLEHYFAVAEHARICMTYKGLKAIVDLAGRFITRGAFPGKAVDLLDDAALAAGHAGERTVTDEHIRDMVSLKARMNIQKATAREKDALLHLEEELSKHIVGQRHAVASLVNALKRARLDVGAGKRPLGTFLFLGPTGVGKTLTAKVLAREYFGSDDRLIRIDMNEYGNEESVFGIIGSPDTTKAGSEGFLLKQVQDNPFSVILLDEIEKAHKKVLNLFLQVLDEGFLVDNFGVKTDFRNAVIVATSNAGADFIHAFVGRSGDQSVDLEKKLLDELIAKGHFSPEFLNRFDEVTVYEPLSREETAQVAEMLVRDVRTKFYEQKGITVSVERDAVAAIAVRGYSPEFGAREMRRVVMESVENFLADYLLRNTVERGGEIRIRREDLKL